MEIGKLTQSSDVVTQLNRFNNDWQQLINTYWQQNDSFLVIVSEFNHLFRNRDICQFPSISFTDKDAHKIAQQKFIFAKKLSLWNGNSSIKSAMYRVCEVFHKLLKTQYAFLSLTDTQIRAMSKFDPMDWSADILDKYQRVKNVMQPAFYHVITVQAFVKLPRQDQDRFILDLTNVTSFLNKPIDKELYTNCPSDELFYEVAASSYMWNIGQQQHKLISSTAVDFKLFTIMFPTQTTRSVHLPCFFHRRYSDLYDILDMLIEFPRVFDARLNHQMSGEIDKYSMYGFLQSVVKPNLTDLTEQQLGELAQAWELDGFQNRDQKLNDIRVKILKQLRPVVDQLMAGDLRVISSQMGQKRQKINDDDLDEQTIREINKIIDDEEGEQ